MDKPITFTATITTDDDGLHIEAWANQSDLDRPRVHGWSAPRHRMDLALRLADAIEAGVALAGGVVLTDARGQTYLSTSSNVLGRRMNADLTTLGF